MKQRVISLLLITALVSSISACGSSGSTSTNDSVAQVESKTASSAATSVEPTTTSEETAAEPNSQASSPVESVEPVAEPLDLTGLWVQPEPEATRMVAEIRDDGKIGIFFITDDDVANPWVYWIGTYDGSDATGTEYSWTSKNTFAGTSMFASTADTKDFTYENESLKFELTIQGKTGEITLVRGDWDNSVISDEVYAEPLSDEDVAAAQSGEVLELTNTGWIVDGDYLDYYLTLHNNSDNTIVELPTIRITARDKDNILLGTTDQTLSVIYPGQDFIYGSQAFSVDEIPETVEFEIQPPNDYNLKRADSASEYVPMEVINSALRSDKFVGEISNSNSYNIDMAYVVVLGKDSDGTIIKVEGTFVNNIPATGTAPFDIHLYNFENVTDYEVYANQW